MRISYGEFICHGKIITESTIKEQKTRNSAIISKTSIEQHVINECSQKYENFYVIIAGNIMISFLLYIKCLFRSRGNDCVDEASISMIKFLSKNTNFVYVCVSSTVHVKWFQHWQIVTDGFQSVNFLSAFNLNDFDNDIVN